MRFYTCVFFSNYLLKIHWKSDKQTRAKSIFGSNFLSNKKNTVFHSNNPILLQSYFNTIDEKKNKQNLYQVIS